VTPGYGTLFGAGNSFRTAKAGERVEQATADTVGPSRSHLAAQILHRRGKWP
jgi:hypothetical protein